MADRHSLAIHWAVRAAIRSLALAFTLYAQTPAAPLRFEVASVKLNRESEVYSGGRPNLTGRPHISGLRVDFQSVTMRSMLAMAYALDPRQIVAPDWVNKSAEEYSIQAVMPAGTTPKDIPEMIKGLLAERFYLLAHRTEADQSAYALVVSKKGAKLRSAREVNESACSDAWQEGYGGNICRIEQTIGDQVVKTQILQDTPNGPILMRFTPQERHTEYYRITMPKLATLLSGMLAPLPPGFRFAFGPHAPYTAVVDRTGISGEWNVAVDQDPTEGASFSSINASLEKYGLLLERTTVPAGKVVIDRIDRLPTAN